MAASFGAELLKLRKRPAVWVLGLLLALSVLLLGYMLAYLAFSDTPTQPGTISPVQVLLPQGLLRTVLALTSNLGGPIALILGALAMGSEYGWGTFKTVLVQGPGRLAVLSGKLTALGVVLLVLTVLVFASGAGGSFAVSRLASAVGDWPPLGATIRGIAAAGLILAAWAALGVFLATLFRGTSLAIGLGLIYAVALENVLAVGLAARSGTAASIRKVLLGGNSDALASAFGSVEALIAPPPLVEPAQAVMVLVAYVLVFLALTALLFKRRDVVG